MRQDGAAHDLVGDAHGRGVSYRASISSICRMVQDGAARPSAAGCCAANYQCGVQVISSMARSLGLRSVEATMHAHDYHGHSC